jgi:hypothetical protein
VNYSLINLLLIFLFIWLTILSAIAWRALVLYKRLVVGIDKADLAKILVQLKKDQHLTQESLQATQKEFEQFQRRTQTYLQKLGFVRYNPFANTGGDQSFCLCFLDGTDNGILITSLHTREQTRLYTKEVVNGEPKEQIKLSKEEALCLKKAKNWGIL